MLRYYWKILILFAAVHGTVLSQNEEAAMSTVGISASLSSSQLDFIFPVRLSEQFVAGPSFGFVHVASVGSDYRIGIMSRFLLTDKPVKPFIGFRAGVIIGSRLNSDILTDGIAGLLGGAEYFINNHISVGIEAQINASVSGNNSSRFGNPGRTNINTATAVYGTLYF